MRRKPDHNVKEVRHVRHLRVTPEQNVRIHALLFISIVSLLLLVSTVQAEQGVGVSGSWVRSVMDDSGNIHMVYCDRWGDVQYMKFNGSSWIGPSYLPASAPQWFDFTNPDIAVGPDGRAQVVYNTTTQQPFPDDFNPIILAKANDADGSSWSITTIGGADERRNHARIAVDENNDPHIVYMRTGKFEPYWWKIVYRRPDGSEKEIDYGVDANRVNNPTIDYGNGMVHIAYYRGGSGSMTTNICYSRDVPYGDFPIWTLTNMPSYWFVASPDVAVAPDGHVEIVFLQQDFSGGTPYYKGVLSARPDYGDVITIDGGWAEIKEHEQEDWAPSITFGTDGTRYVAWSHYSNGETLYKIGDGPKVTLEPFGHVDVCGGPGGVYYTRIHGSPGPIYYDQIGGGGPPNQLPVVDFDWSPETGDYETLFSFDASDTYDPDGDTPLIYGWDWENDGTIDYEIEGTATATHTFGYPGEYEVFLEVTDARGGKGYESRHLTVMNYPPEAEFEATQLETLSVLFDASASSDTEDEKDLRYSWDFLGNGIFSRPTEEDSTLYIYDEAGTYQVTLRVEDQLGAVDDTTMSVEVMGDAPAAPGSLIAEDYPEDQGDQIALSWTLSPDDLRGMVHSYIIRRHPAGEPEYVEMLIPAGDSTYVDSVVTGEPFDYRIAAYDSTSLSYSEWIYADSSVTARDNLEPEDITDFEADLVTLDTGWQVTLHWTPSASPDLLTQSIYRSMGDGDWSGLVTLQPTATTFRDTIMDVGDYFYRIHSEDGWNITISDSVGVEAAGTNAIPGLPEVLTVTGINPNPTRGTATVRFAVPHAGDLGLMIYDLNGRRVINRTMRFEQGGWFHESIELTGASGTSLPSGTYMMHLSFDGHRASAPVVIVR